MVEASFEGRLAIDVLAERILAQARPTPSELNAWRKPMRDIERLMRRDYVRALRRWLGYRELRSLVSAGAKVWPQLNHERIRLKRSELADISWRLSVHLSARPHREADGMALRGFYVRKSESALKRPLIYVNTAHHPAAVGATFCHEVGHHLAARLFAGKKMEPVNFFYDAAYATHLDDPVELAADVLVSLAAYPEPIARRIFAKSCSGGLVARAQHLSAEAVTQICNHLKRGYRVDFTRSGQPRRDLTYLAGMVHFAKLRWGILAEYDL